MQDGHSAGLRARGGVEVDVWQCASFVCVCVCVSAHTTSAITQKLCTNHQAVLARGVALETEANHVQQQQQRCHERTRGAALLRSLGAKRPRHRPWWRNAEGTDKRGEEPHPCAPFAPCHSSHCPCKAKHMGSGRVPRRMLRGSQGTCWDVHA